MRNFVCINTCFTVIDSLLRHVAPRLPTPIKDSKRPVLIQGFLRHVGNFLASCGFDEQRTFLYLPLPRANGYWAIARNSSTPASNCSFASLA